MSSTLTVNKRQNVSGLLGFVEELHDRTWSLDVADNASACVVHEFDSDLRNTSSRTYVKEDDTVSLRNSTAIELRATYPCDRVLL